MAGISGAIGGGGAGSTKRIDLAAGQIYEVYNSAGTLIFRIDQNGNVAWLGGQGSL
jgi:hypothetical protein